MYLLFVLSLSLWEMTLQCSQHQNQFFEKLPLLFAGRKKNKRLKETLYKIYLKRLSWNYSASATTSFTSGIIRFIIPSIPAFNVIMLEGHPLQLPCNIRFTTPSL